MSIKFFLTFEVPQSRKEVTVSVCKSTLKIIAEEVASDLNRYATQVLFRVHEPTASQLMTNYVDTGGMQRCLDKMNHPYATISVAA